MRTTHADALHQAGRRAEAETRFREAEQMQEKSQPDYPLLYSLQGFKYCDLLLADAERAAWQKFRACHAVRGSAVQNRLGRVAPSPNCAASERAEWTEAGGMKKHAPQAPLTTSRWAGPHCTERFWRSQTSEAKRQKSNRPWTAPPLGQHGRTSSRYSHPRLVTKSDERWRRGADGLG